MVDSPQPVRQATSRQGCSGWMMASASRWLMRGRLWQRLWQRLLPAPNGGVLLHSGQAERMRQETTLRLPHPQGCSCLCRAGSISHASLDSSTFRPCITESLIARLKALYGHLCTAVTQPCPLSGCPKPSHPPPKQENLTPWWQDASAIIHPRPPSLHGRARCPHILNPPLLPSVPFVSSSLSSNCTSYPAALACPCADFFAPRLKASLFALAAARANSSKPAHLFNQRRPYAPSPSSLHCCTRSTAARALAPFPTCLSETRLLAGPALPSPTTRTGAPSRRINTPASSASTPSDPRRRRFSASAAPKARTLASIR
ncbi:hypothetical protein TOPH_00174 [Tolypocladium ophioglossoides CBS 100239]|uniref:Uncharacterized protein n=1 Tax=Tolypocladium ophioglossoides (strain CBS 100239) TaxID=1163406 RepID=A0A0L0NLZ5_TOLOC|nr:hypothetical protein TOPH_00174 [Tolypocladium ophioglossoides CBS 100239]